jgi:quercetin dioxygenase-like cupin family protein
MMTRCFCDYTRADKETPMNVVVRVVVKAVAVVACVTAALAGIVAGVSAQQAGFKRTVLQQGNLSMPGREVVQAIAEFQPGATVGRHTHPGEEVGYVLEGTIVLEQEGKPTVTLGAGKTFLIPPGTVHNATNSGSSQARVLATYIVEKGKPLATAVK